jgi:hypothetical protein
MSMTPPPPPLRTPLLHRTAGADYKRPLLAILGWYGVVNYARCRADDWSGSH